MSVEKIKRNTVFVSFATQKGGAGKTTTTMQTASMLAALSDLKVAVIDLDPQRSLSNKRDREWEELESLEDTNSTNAKAYMKLRGKGREKFDVFQLDIFPSVSADTEPKRRAEWKLIEAKIEAKRISGEYDIIFFDFPGVTAVQQIVDTLSLIDYFLIPFYVDDNTIDSGMTFLNAIIELKDSGTTKIKDYAAYKWKYAKNKNVAEFEAIFKSLSAMGTTVFENKVYESLEVERQRSTINPFDLPGEKSHKPFIDELLRFVGIIKDVK